MLKTLARFLLITLLPLLTTGCWVFGFGFARAVPVQPGGPPPGVPPTPVIPQIRLEYGGQSVTGVQSFYNWQASSGSALGGGSSAPGQPGTRLTAPAGASVNIVVALSAPPAVLWVAELDPNGAPIKAAAITPTSNTVPYPLDTPGQYLLQVTAEWTYQNQVTYIFELDVK